MLIFSILRFISTKCCKTQKVTEPQMPQSPAHQLFGFVFLDRICDIQSCRCWGVITSGISITYENNTLERELETTVDIKRFEEVEYFFKIWITPIIITHGNHQIVDAIHHTSLEDVLQKLVV